MCRHNEAFSNKGSKLGEETNAKHVSTFYNVST